MSTTTLIMRMLTLSGMKTKILKFVVCVFKAESSVRLISTRFAAAAERRRYEYGEDIF